MKGIVLAGGSGTRLYPLTLVTSKQLLPIYDKPMIYYPISVLMLAGIRDILIISTEKDIPNFQRLLGDGKAYGLNLSYKVQPSPDGLAQAFLLGEEFINGEPCAMILGDNLFYGSGLSQKLLKAKKAAYKGHSTIFGYYVNNPEDFGVIEFDSKNRVLSLEEKPDDPKSNYIATGLYFYSKDVVEKAKLVKPSERNELEITDLNKLYIEEGRLDLELLGRGYAWMDAGTMDSLYEASSFVRILEDRQGIQVAALEEIAFYNKWITKQELRKAVEKHGKSLYGEHLSRVLGKKLKHN
ncbi:MAG: glucose-1-phosphate thymidylyltransferase RfbA [Clostridia bacterium]|nr:glucose-1-phosphate thymidylyltransferase RfbA [Clostridia bacterium]